MKALTLKRLAGDGAFALTMKVAGAGLSYMMLVAVARVTAPEEVGAFASALSFALIATFLATIGQPSAALRFVPQFIGQDRSDEASGVLGRGLRITLGGGAAFALVAAVMVMGMSYGTGANRAALAAATGALCVAMALAEYLAAALRAKGRIVWGLAPRDVAWRAAVTLAFVAASQVGLRGHAPLLVIFTAGVLAALLAIQFSVLLTAAPDLLRTRMSSSARPAYLKTSLGLWVIASGDRLISSTGVIVVGFLVDPISAGAFYAAERIAKLVSMPLVAVNAAAAPAISYRHHRGEKREVQRIAAFVAVGSAAASIVGLLGLSFLGASLLQWVDPGYGQAWGVLMVLAVAATVSALFGPNGMLLQMSGEEGRLVPIVLVVAVIGVATQCIGAHIAGPMGAAIAVLIATSIYNLASTLTLRRAIGINSTVFGLSVLLKRQPKPHSSPAL